ncbi:hypothetical protein SAMN04488601_10728, partial [Paenibacillus sp. 453mf]
MKLLGGICCFGGRGKGCFVAIVAYCGGRGNAVFVLFTPVVFAWTQVCRG